MNISIFLNHQVIRRLNAFLNLRILCKMCFLKNIGNFILSGSFITICRVWEGLNLIIGVQSVLIIQTKILCVRNLFKVHNTFLFVIL